MGFVKCDNALACYCVSKTKPQVVGTPQVRYLTSADYVSCSAHWLVVNIPESKVDSGQTVLEYKCPAPPAGTGYHRYIFKLYSQGDKTIQVKSCFFIWHVSQSHQTSRSILL